MVDDATGLFDSFFPVLGGNTAASGGVRLQVLDEAAKSDDLAQLRILVKALIKGAQTESTMRTVGAEVHGHRARHCKGGCHRFGKTRGTILISAWNAWLT